MNKIGVLLDWCMSRIASLPSTNLRIFVTIGLTVATGAVYLILAVKSKALGGESWTPAWEWLTFLVANSGLDAVQFTAKRMTQKTEPPNATG